MHARARTQNLSTCLVLSRVDLSGQVGSLPAIDPSPGGSSASRGSLGLAVGLGVGLGLLVAAALIVVLLYRRRRQQQQQQQQSVAKCEAAAVSGDGDGGGDDGVKDKQGSVWGGAQAPWKAGLLALKGQRISLSNDGTNGVGSPKSSFEQQHQQAQSG